MGYQNEYIIDPETDDEQPVVQKEMEPISIPNNKINREYEIIEEPKSNSKSVLDEIHESAILEGLVDEDEEPIGGENPTPESVISDLRNRGMSKGAQKNKEEYEENKVNKTRKVMATREILTGMRKQVLEVTVPVVLPVRQPNGDIENELVDMELKAKRLTESQVNHLFNRQIANKDVSELTPEELEEDKHFRSNFLAEAVVEPKMPASVWYNEVPAIALGTIFNKVQEVLSSIDNTELFQ